MGYADADALIVLGSWVMIASGAATFCALMLGMVAPYGRYSRGGWGTLIPSKAAWMMQELPSLLIPLALWRIAREQLPWGRRTLLLMFLLHYSHRSLLYPLLQRGGKPTPLIVCLMAFLFCAWNGLLQGWWLTRGAGAAAEAVVLGPRFVVGCCAWLAGAAVNLHSDHVLRSLRAPGEQGYKIPRGGAFRFVSGANFSGEILEWVGWAAAAGKLPGVAFAFFTFCNIAPRAWHHHCWYQQKFKNYPKDRRAVIPFIW